MFCASTVWMIFQRKIENQEHKDYSQTPGSDPSDTVTVVSEHKTIKSPYFVNTIVKLSK